jgi:hypothetical protein
MSWAKLARHITTFFSIGGKKEQFAWKSTAAHPVDQGPHFVRRRDATGIPW